MVEDRYIDVHCHLDDAKFENDLDDIISRAKESGIVIIHSGINPETNRKAIEIANKYDIYCSFGIYPIDAVIKDFPNVTDDYPREVPAFDVDDELQWIEENKEKCVAIGEVGLEYKVIDDTPQVRQAQENNFRKIVQLAMKVDLPLVIHSRGGELECTEIMEELGATKVLMHCFGGKKGLVKRGAANGWYFSVPPVITRLHHFEFSETCSNRTISD
jgi:TatD DNase family protein